MRIDEHQRRVHELRERFRWIHEQNLKQLNKEIRQMHEHNVKLQALAKPQPHTVDVRV